MPPFIPGLSPTDTHTFVIAFMNPLSVGSVTLRSANPADPPLIDPKAFDHPFDRRVAIESMREALTFLDTLQAKYIIAPGDRSDGAIWVSQDPCPLLLCDCVFECSDIPCAQGCRAVRGRISRGRSY